MSLKYITTLGQKTLPGQKFWSQVQASVVSVAGNPSFAEAIPMLNASGQIDASMLPSIQSLQIEVNGTPAPVQNVANFIAGANIAITSDAQGGITIEASGSFSSSFSAISSGTNTTSSLMVGGTASLGYTGSGTVDANKIGHIDVAVNAPSHEGQLLISQPGNSSAAWADPMVQGLYPEGSSIALPPPFATPTTIQPVYVGGQGTDGNLHGVSMDNSGRTNVNVANFPATQPISGTVSINPIPAGTNLIGQIEISDGTNILGTSAHPLKVDGSGATQPVVGTVTANIGTTNGLALDASVSGILVAQGSATSGEKGPLIQGAVTTNTAIYTTAQTSPLSLDTSGLLRVSLKDTPANTNALKVDGSAVTQPVSGTVATTQSGTWTIGLSAGTNLIGKVGIDQTTPGTTNGVQVNAALPAGTNTIGSVKLTDGTSIATIASLTNSKALDVAIVDGAGTQITSFGGGTQFADGSTSATPTGTVAMGKNASNIIHAFSLDTSGNLNVNMAAGSISGGNAAASPTGAAVPASADFLGAQDGSGNLRGLLVESSANPNLRVAIYGGTNEATVSAGGAVKVDGSAVTQPVSGTVTANAGSGSFTVAQATAANLNATVTGTVAATQSGTWNIGTLTSITNAVTVNGTVTANAGTGTFATSDANAASQGSTTSGEKGFLQMGAVTTASPTYTTAQTSPLSLDTSGNLRTSVNNTVAVTGTVAATQSGTWTVGISASQTIAVTQATAANLNATVTGTVAATQSGTWTVQPGNTANTTPWLMTVSQGGNSATVSAGGALKVDGSAVTQPISGTITANAGTGTFTTSDANVVSQGSTTSGEKGFLQLGAVTTAAPTYTTAQTSPLSLDTSGNLRTSVNNTVAVSGTVAATQSGTWTVGISAAQTIAVTQATAANLNATVTGTVAATQSGTWNIGTLATITNPVTVTGTVTANIGTTGGITVAQGSTTSGQSGPLAQGAVTTAAPTYTTAQTSPLSLTTAGALRVDGSAATQPVSGTVTANAGTGTFAISAAALPLPSGAATSAKQPALGTAGSASADVITVQGIASMTALKVDGSAVTQPVSGTVTSNQGTANTTANAWPIKVTDGTNAVTVASLTNSKALAVEIVDGAGTQITSFGGGTQYADGTTQATPTGTIALGKNASNVVHALSLDTSGNLNVNLAAGSISGGNAAASPTGAAVPASADYLGAQDGSGNLQGLLVESVTRPNLRVAIYNGANEASVSAGGAITVDGSAVTQPVSAASLPLPSGASTSAKQPALGTAGTASADVITVQGIASMTALKVDGSAVTQPVSGTVTTNQGGTWTNRIVGNAGASLDAAVGAGTAPTNALIVGSQFNSTAPVPTSGQTMSLQADQAGNLRVFNGIASGALVTISAANTNDTLNSVQNIFTNSGGDAAIVQLTPTGTLTTGAVTFEVSFDGSSWQTVPASAVMDPTSTTFAQIAVPFTPVSSTNKFFLITNNGWQGLRLKVSTAFTGTGHSVAVNYTLVSYDPVDNVIALSPSAANFNAAIKRAPDATSTFAPTSVDSTALEASHILKASAGVLYGVTGYSARTTSQFIQVHNTTTVPGDTAVPIVVFFIPAGPVSFSWDAPAQFGKFFSTGITICNSTTGPAKTLGSADCWFNASLA